MTGEGCAITGVSDYCKQLRDDLRRSKEQCWHVTSQKHKPTATVVMTLTRIVFVAGIRRRKR